jgi:Leucine-rich repeat (LRR) protein
VSFSRFIILFYGLIIVLAGCGGGGSSSTNPSPSPAPVPVPSTTPESNMILGVEVGSPALAECLQAEANAVEAAVPSDIRQIICINKNITNLAGLPEFNQIELLNLSGNNLETATFSSFESLRDLDLSNNEIHSLGLSDLPALEALKVGGNNLSALDVTPFLGSLKSIDASDNPLSGANIVLSSFVPDFALAECIQLAVDNAGIEHLSELVALTCKDSGVVSPLGIEMLTALSELDLSGNALTWISLEGLTQLLSLDLGGNTLSDLDLTEQPVLNYFIANNNALVNLHLGQVSALETVDLSENSLTSLDLRTALSSLVSLNVGGNPISEGATWDSSSVFQDPNLAECIDESLSNNSIENVADLTNLDCSSIGIVNPLNLGYFQSLQELDLSANPLLRISVNELRQLEILNLSDSSLMDLDVSELSFLSYLDVSDSSLEEIGFGSNSNLERANLSNNNLSEVNFSDARVSLRHADLSGNPISSNLLIGSVTFVDEKFADCVREVSNTVSSLAEITKLSCSEIVESLHGIGSLVGLEELRVWGGDWVDFSALTNLTELTIGYGGYEEIDLSQNTQLVRLSIYWSLITQLELDGLVSLRELVVENTDLGGIDISDNASLTRIALYEIGITNLDLSNAMDLAVLDIKSNGISNLDLTHNAKLVTLHANNNEIVDLDLSSNSALRWVTLSDNPLSVDSLEHLGSLPSDVIVDVLQVSPSVWSGVTVYDPNLISCLKGRYSELTPFIYSLECLRLGIRDLTGLKELIELGGTRYLVLGGNNFASIDLSFANSLIHIYLIDSSDLQDVDVSGSAELTTLYVWGSQLDNIDLSSNNLLHTLYLANNNIAEINIDNNPLLENLYLQENPLTEETITYLLSLEIPNLVY